MITDISILNDYFICIDFHTSLGFAIIFVFLYLSRCSAVITMKLLLLLLLVSWGQGGVDDSWDGFSESYIRRIHCPFELVLCQYPPEVSHCRSRNGILARKAQERARTSLQMMHFCYYNVMETTIDRIFLQWEKCKYSHVERRGVWVHLKPRVK